jgi:hypothetical protein
MFALAAVATLSNVPISLLAQGGFGLLVTISVWFIYTGRLVPRSTLQKAEEREAKWQQVAEETLAQNRQLLDGFRVVNDVLQAIPRVRDGSDK